MYPSLKRSELALEESELDDHPHTHPMGYNRHRRVACDQILERLSLKPSDQLPERKRKSALRSKDCGQLGGKKKESY